MRYGFIIPGGDVHTLADLARAAEDAGWDGVFTWDGIQIHDFPINDPWVALAAMATRTDRIRLGAMLTPVARRRPWKLARETVTLDHLSRGRLILPVGLGTLDDGGFSRVNEPRSRRERAERLDEGLAILTGLWSGQPFSFQGRHYQVEALTFVPPPVQQPRIPIWVVGAWPSAKSMDRAARYDGLLPAKIGEHGADGTVVPEDIRAMAEYVAARRPDATPFDIVMEGRTRGDDRAQQAETIGPFAEAGVTWWLEQMWGAPNATDDVRARIRQGPPQV